MTTLGDGDTTRALENQMRMEIREIGIPPRPSILTQIDQEFTKDEPDFSRLAKAIGSDVGISAALIKVTNSPYYGFSKKVRTVSEALLVLGLRLMVQTIAGLELQRVFKHTPQMARFWDASATTARVSGWLAARLRGKCGVRPEDAYTFSLFRDCGIPVILIPFPDYRDVLGQANEERNLSFTEVEDRLIGINHANVGADLAETWLLPEEISVAIRHHHQIALIGSAAMPAIPAVAWTLIAIANLAEHLIQQKTGLAHTSEWHKAAELNLQHLRLSEQDLLDIENDCGEVVADAK